MKSLFNKTSEEESDNGDWYATNDNIKKVVEALAVAFDNTPAQSGKRFKEVHYRCQKGTEVEKNCKSYRFSYVEYSLEYRQMTRTRNWQEFSEALYYAENDRLDYHTTIARRPTNMESLYNKLIRLSWIFDGFLSASEKQYNKVGYAPIRTIII